MLTLLLLLLALSLPFGVLGPLFTLGAFQVSAPAFLALVAVVWSLASSLGGKTAPDMAGWAAIGWAGAWLVSSLAAPMAWAPASRAAWEMAAGPIIFSCVRPVLTPRSRNTLLAGLGTALVISLFLHFAGNAGFILSAGIQAVPWAAFLANPLAGAGPGAFPGMPLFTGLLPRGGLLAAAAGLFLLWALGREIFRIFRQRRPGLGPVLPAMLLAALITSGFTLNPLASPGLGLGFWLALGALLPPARPAYNAGKRA